MAVRYRYSRWDGTQRGFELDAKAVFDQLTDDLVEHGDAAAALRRLMNDGLRLGDEQLPGLRELFQRLRQERRRMLDSFDLGSVYDDLRRELDDIVDEERHAIDDLRTGAGTRSAPDSDAAAAAERLVEFDFLPDDLPGKVAALRRHRFTSLPAQGRFEAFVERLTARFANQLVDRMHGSMAALDDDSRAAMRTMLAALNDMLARHRVGEDPRFEEFMTRFGEWFPEQPDSVEELIELLARRMAAMQQLFNSLTPEQRAELAALSQQLLGDAALADELGALADALRQLVPDAGWEQGWRFNGEAALGLDEAGDMMERLADLDRLDELLRGAASPSALADADLDSVRDLLGDDAAQALQRMAELTEQLRAAGLIDVRDGALELSPAAVRRLGANALRDVFERLDSESFGQHQLRRVGIGHEPSGETKPLEFGDPFRLDLQRTLRNALRRQAAAGGAGSRIGVPLRLTADDFEIDRTEQLVRSSTVLALDLSMSMPMEGRFVPAKKVAMALHALISAQFPNDDLDVVVFSETARRIRPTELPQASWDYVYGTNMQHALMIARSLLAGRPGNRQILLITDGEPTAHITASGMPQFHYPPLPETVDVTLREVVRCTRAGIRINTFMLGTSAPLRAFVERVTALNRGRAFFATPENLGDYVLVDYLDERRRALARHA